MLVSDSIFDKPLVVKFKMNFLIHTNQFSSTTSKYNLSLKKDPILRKHIIIYITNLE